jgi:hypothetical protein
LPPLPVYSVQLEYKKPEFQPQLLENS